LRNPDVSAARKTQPEAVARVGAAESTPLAPSARKQQSAWLQSMGERRRPFLGWVVSCRALADLGGQLCHLMGPGRSAEVLELVCHGLGLGVPGEQADRCAGVSVTSFLAPD
jgi:hypothetical protein